MATWRTRDGRVLDMAEMSDEHLGNAVEMMKRKLVSGLRTLDALEAEQRRRADDWKVTFEAPCVDARWGSSIETIERRGDRRIVTRLLRERVPLNETRAVYSVEWYGPSRRLFGKLVGQDPTLLRRVAKAVDAACFEPRRP
jgi:hypothetical protein